MSFILYQCATKGLKMLLSDDGKTLIKVMYEDLVNGEFVFPGTVTRIEDRTFYKCSSLTHVTIPDSVTHIGLGAFAYCSSLTHVTIPNSVTHIENSTFELCKGLTHVTIPNFVTRIGVDAFSGCSSLTQVTIPNSVTHIDRLAFCTSAFRGCPHLKVIAIENSNLEDYQRILNLLPHQQHLARPWSELKYVQKIKQLALKSVAALSMNGLTAHLVFRLLSDDGKIAGGHGCQVDTASFFKRLNHARQPALASNPDVSRLTITGNRFPKYAERMLPRLCDVMAFRLNPTVAQITMPTSPQEADSYFEQIVKSKVQPTKSLTLWAYIWKCICDFFNWIIEKFSSVTNSPMQAQAFA